MTSSALTCGDVSLTSDALISVSAGATLGARYQHVIGGAQGPNDPDNPIAASHKGPITAWLAKVDDAVSTSHDGLDWFKISEDTLDTSTGLWAVDELNANDGWYDFTLPSCIADGQYLLRVEIIALHSAYASKGAQFYSSCAQIDVSGGGSFEAGETFQIPGVYAQDDPSIMINIYGTSGGPDNDGKEYVAPGPRPISC